METPSATSPTPSQPAAVIACRQAVHTLRDFHRDATKTYLPATKLGLNDPRRVWLRTYREIAAEWHATEVELDAIPVPEEDELELILWLERQFVGSVRLAAEQATAHVSSRQIRPEDKINAPASQGKLLHDVAADRLSAFDPASCDHAGEPPQI